MEEVRAKITHMLGKRGVFLDTLTDPAPDDLPVFHTHVGAPQRAPLGNGARVITHGAFYRSGKITTSFTYGVESRHLQLFGGCLYTLINEHVQAVCREIRTYSHTRWKTYWFTFGILAEHRPSHTLTMCGSSSITAETAGRWMHNSRKNKIISTILD